MILQRALGCDIEEKRAIELGNVFRTNTNVTKLKLIGPYDDHNYIHLFGLLLICVNLIDCHFDGSECAYLAEALKANTTLSVLDLRSEKRKCHQFIIVFSFFT